MEEKTYFVYIITNQYNKVLYTGITNNLERRVYEHKHKLIPGFSSKYNCHKLVWFDVTDSVESAISREKQIKAGSRKKKIDLIQSINPEWKDMADEWDNHWLLWYRLDRRAALAMTSLNMEG